MNSGHIIKPVLAASLMGEAIQMVYDLRFMIALSLILIIADFWFGCSEAVKKGVPLRKSKAGRRTLNKFVDYICYLLIGGLFGKAIFEPLGVDYITVAAIALGVTYIIELGSITGHICELHGYTVHISIKKILIAFLRTKSEDAAQALEEGLEIKDDESERNTKKKD